MLPKNTPIFTPPKTGNELFILPYDLLISLDMEEVEATVQALKDCQLYALPFPKVDIRIPGDLAHCHSSVEDFKPEEINNLNTAITDGWVVNHEGKLYYKVGPTFWCDFLNISLESSDYTKAMLVERRTQVGPHTAVTPFYEGWHGDSTAERDLVANLLIIALATRNTIKTRLQNKLAKLGIGKKPGKQHIWVTTITIPKELEHDAEHKPTGVTRCPHLRRGHARNQHYGPHNSYIKKIWIAPVFVNADPEWKASRKAYNVSL